MLLQWFATWKSSKIPLWAVWYEFRLPVAVGTGSYHYDRSTSLPLWNLVLNSPASVLKMTHLHLQDVTGTAGSTCGRSQWLSPSSGQRCSAQLWFQEVGMECPVLSAIFQGLTLETSSVDPTDVMRSEALWQKPCIDNQTFGSRQFRRKLGSEQPKTPAIDSVCFWKVEQWWWFWLPFGNIEWPLEATRSVGAGNYSSNVFSSLYWLCHSSQLI